MAPEKSVPTQPARVNALRRIVVAAALGALTVFLGITRLGILPWLTGASLTILHVPALVGAILEGPLVGGAIGAIFGVFSLIQAYTAPSGPIDIAFQSLLVALPARVLFPIIAWLIYRGLSILFGKVHGKLKYAAVPVSALAGSLCHTALVLLTLSIVVPAEDLLGGAASATVASVLAATFVFNGIPEAIAAAVFVAVIVSIWTGVSSRRRSRVSEL